MAKNTFEFGWIGHCEHGNKIWGWFRDKSRDRTPHTYCFWAVCGKTIMFTKYPHWNNHIIDEIQKHKVVNKYFQISMDQLIAMWPDFMQELEDKFLWDKLSEKI